MEGDKLARGARSATFAVAPNLRFDEGIMRDDLLHLSAEEFMLKYMITRREYDMHLNSNDDDKVSAFAEEMKQRAEFYNQELARDEKQEASLSRDCFIEPFVAFGITGRVIVSRDAPPTKKSALLLPQSQRKSKTLLPTTGHVIKEKVFDSFGNEGTISYLGKRVLFSPMSGTAICFKGFPTWIQLELSEILGFVNKEDVNLIEEDLESMV